MCTYEIGSTSGSHLGGIIELDTQAVGIHGGPGSMLRVDGWH